MKRIGLDARKIDDFGIGTYITHLLEEFANRSAPYEFVLFGDVVRLQERFGSRFELVAAAAAKYSIGEQLELPWLIHKRRLDVFHSPHYVIPVCSRCPLVVTVHDLIHLRTDIRQGWKNRLVSVYAQMLIGQAVRQARRVIVDSHAVRREIETHFSAAQGKTVAIHLAADAALAAPATPTDLDGFRRERELAHPLLLFVGNPAPHKNLPAMLATVAELRHRGYLVQLAMAGCKAEIVAAQVRAYGLQDIVRVLGYLSPHELALAYQAADVLLFPSLLEGFGLPVLEAMQAGLVVVASNIPSLTEVVGDAAITVDPRDVSGLADAVVRVLDDPGQRAQLVERGRKRAGRFRWSTCAEAHLRVYEEAISLTGRHLAQLQGPLDLPSDGSRR
jgi:glycosyltransferase involved in cell wall biosynthesis